MGKEQWDYFPGEALIALVAIGAPWHLSSLWRSGHRAWGTCRPSGRSGLRASREGGLKENRKKSTSATGALVVLFWAIGASDGDEGPSLLHFLNLQGQGQKGQTS
jgi:hypothetical protein